jgi:hypothetical protein
VVDGGAEVVEEEGAGAEPETAAADACVEISISPPLLLPVLPVGVKCGVVTGAKTGVNASSQKWLSVAES